MHPSRLIRYLNANQELEEVSLNHRKFALPETAEHNTSSATVPSHALKAFFSHMLHEPVERVRRIRALRSDLCQVQWTPTTARLFSGVLHSSGSRNENQS